MGLKPIKCRIRITIEKRSKQAGSEGWCGKKYRCRVDKTLHYVISLNRNDRSIRDQKRLALPSKASVMGFFLFMGIFYRSADHK